MFSKNIAKNENNIIYQFKAIIIPLNEVCHSLFLKDLEYNAYMWQISTIRQMNKVLSPLSLSYMIHVLK